MKKKLFIVFVICLCSFSILSGCEKSRSEETASNDNSQSGIMEKGKDITDYFDLVGNRTVVCCNGDHDSIAVYVSDTVDGGCVAWKDEYYCYSPDGGSVRGYTLASRLAIDVYGLELYNFD